MMVKKISQKEMDLLWKNSSPKTMFDLYSRLKSKDDYFEIITMTNVSQWYNQTNILAKI
jgi:hypothetical protein